MDAAMIDSIDACREVEIRDCVIKALAKAQNWDIDIDDQFHGELEPTDEADWLDEQAHAVVIALIENGYLDV